MKNHDGNTGGDPKYVPDSGRRKVSGGGYGSSATRSMRNNDMNSGGSVNYTPDSGPNGQGSRMAKTNSGILSDSGAGQKMDGYTPQSKRTNAAFNEAFKADRKKITRPSWSAKA